MQHPCGVRMRKLICAITVSMAAATSSAAELHFRFSQFPAEAYKGEVAPSRWIQRKVPVDEYVAARIDMFIDHDYHERAHDVRWRYGGRYFLYTTGCGTECQAGVIFNLKTGEVVAQLPSATSGYEYRPHSNLLVVNPTDQEILESRERFWEQTTYYYLWSGKDWALLAEEPWPATVDEESDDGRPLASDVRPGREVLKKLLERHSEKTTNCLTEGSLKGIGEAANAAEECAAARSTASQNETSPQPALDGLPALSVPTPHLRPEPSADRKELGREQQSEAAAVSVLVPSSGSDGVMKLELRSAASIDEGMSRDQVSSILGQPSRKETVPPDDELWYYNEGHVSFFQGKVAFLGGRLSEVATSPSDADDASSSDGDKDPGIHIGHRAIFYEERTSASQGSAEPGGVMWSLVQESPGDDLPPEPAIRGDVTIPGRNVELKLTIRRNADPALPADHVVELVFLTPEGFEGLGIDNVLRMVMKSSEQATGDPVLGIPAKIADRHFIIALSNTQAEQETNELLMRRQSWIDIPIVYKSGRRALVTLEKGDAGERLFQQVIDAWSRKQPAKMPVTSDDLRRPKEWGVQIASQPTSQAAKKISEDLRERYSGILHGRKITVARFDISGKGTYYRVRVLTGTKEEGVALCKKLKAAGGSCFVAR